MRLLDLIAQQPQPFWVQQADGRVVRLSGAADFAASIRACPLRYVLTDALVRDCTALAYSDGVHLAECLDLVHLPAHAWWVEWNDAVRMAEYERALGIDAGAGAAAAGAASIDAATAQPASTVARAGVLVSAAQGGRRGTMRSFWCCNDAQQEPLLAPLEIHFDLDAIASERGTLESLLQGACAAVPIEAEPGVSAVLQRARYRFDASWLDYYQRNAASPEVARELLQQSLGTVASDFPLVIALLLMMTVRGGLPQRQENLAQLNAKRMRLGRAPLLEHIEVSSPVMPRRWAAQFAFADSARRAPRLHHVRGHLVRRANALFWRTPHWRGHLRLGQVRSRTVTLHS